MQTFVAVVLPWPDPTLLDSLLDLHRQRVEVLAIVIDPQTFPDGGLSAASFADQIQAAGIETSYIKFAEDWADQLSGDWT